MARGDSGIGDSLLPDAFAFEGNSFENSSSIFVSPLCLFVIVLNTRLQRKFAYFLLSVEERDTGT